MAAKRSGQHPKYVENAPIQKLGYTGAPTEVGNQKYVLTDNKRIFRGATLYQIKALYDFDMVKKGELGGWVSDDKRLGHSGDCWISEQAVVYEEGRVVDDAWATEGSIVRGKALLSGKSCLFGNVVMEGASQVEGDVQLGGDISIGGKLRLRGTLRLNSTTELKEYFKEYAESKKRLKEGRRLG